MIYLQKQGEPSNSRLIFYLQTVAKEKNVWYN